MYTEQVAKAEVIAVKTNEVVKELKDEIAVKDELSLEAYQYSDDPDMEIEFLAARRLSHEKNIVFSKNGIIKFIESLLAEEIQEITDGESWVLKKQANESRVYIKKGGSKFED